MDSINDIVFGELNYNGYWMREIELTFLGSKKLVELIVEENDDDDEIILDEQRTAFQNLPKAILKAEDEIFKYYQTICKEYRYQLGDQADTRMPIINKISDLSELIELTGVVFPMVLDAGDISVGFLLECPWDPEHGMGVKITNDSIEVGSQDILT